MRSFVLAVLKTPCRTYFPHQISLCPLDLKLRCGPGTAMTIKDTPSEEVKQIHLPAMDAAEERYDVNLSLIRVVRYSITHRSLFEAGCLDAASSGQEHPVLIARPRRLTRRPTPYPVRSSLRLSTLSLSAGPSPCDTKTGSVGRVRFDIPDNAAKKR